jgi:hypothetical protein
LKVVAALAAAGGSVTRRARAQPTSRQQVQRGTDYSYRAACD